MIDIFPHSDEINFLCQSGNIFSYNEDTHRLIKSDKAEMLVSFAGYVYALKNKSLFKISSSYSSNQWKWNLCDWTPSEITYIHTTPNHKFLILQTLNAAYIYNNPNSLENIIYPDQNGLVLRFDNNLNYITMNYQTNQLHYDNDIYDHIKDATLINGKLYFIKEEDPYQKIRICDEEPYYI